MVARVYCVHSCTAAYAAASIRLDVLVEKLLPVVIRELFAWLYGAFCHNEDAPHGAVGFAVGTAGVVDEARGICRNITVDHCCFSCPEEIFAFITCFFSSGCRATDVFKNARALWDFFFSKQALAACGALHAQPKVARSVFCATHHALA